MCPWHLVSNEELHSLGNSIFPLRCPDMRCDYRFPLCMFLPRAQHDLNVQHFPIVMLLDQHMPSVSATETAMAPQALGFHGVCDSLVPG